MRKPVAGILVEFVEPGQLLAALGSVRAAGFTRYETFAPFPVEGVAELSLRRPSPIPGIMLGAGALGALGGFCLQWDAARDYPVNVGGRPVFSWPAFVPVTFELGVLTAVLVGITAFLCFAGLPRYHHPVFSATRFSRASSDRFFLWLCDDDPRFSEATASRLLLEWKPESITEITA